MVKQFLLKGFPIIFIVLLQMSVVGVLLSGFYLHEFFTLLSYFGPCPVLY